MYYYIYEYYQIHVIYGYHLLLILHTLFLTFASALRPKKLTLKGPKQYWCTFKDITISCYKSREEAHGIPAHQMNLRGEDYFGFSFQKLILDSIRS